MMVFEEANMKYGIKKEMIASFLYKVTYCYDKICLEIMPFHFPKSKESCICANDKYNNNGKLSQVI